MHVVTSLMKILDPENEHLKNISKEKSSRPDIQFVEEKILKVAHDNWGILPIFDSDAILNAKSTRIIVLFLCFVFESRSRLSLLKEAPRLKKSTIENFKEEKTFQIWANSLPFVDPPIQNLLEECKTGAPLLQIFISVFNKSKMKINFSSLKSSKERVQLFVSLLSDHVGLDLDPTQVKNILKGKRETILLAILHLMEYK